MIIHCGDALGVLRTLPSESVQMIVTSPPYYGLRAYLADNDPNKPKEIGSEKASAEYIARLVAVFREARRILRDDGTLWVDIGDSYSTHADKRSGQFGGKIRDGADDIFTRSKPKSNLGEKQLLGIPWRLAFALQDDGWILRQDIIWAKAVSGSIRKGSTMPESVRDRFCKSHEYVFLFSKSKRYFFDSYAVADKLDNTKTQPATATRRSVWLISPQPFHGSHFAVFPEALVEVCVKAGTSEKGCCPICGKAWERVVETKPMEIRRSGRAEQMGRFGRTQASGTMVSPAETKTIGWRPGCKHDAEPISCVVLDPFSGAGTTGLVCAKLGRDYIGIDLKAEYCQMAKERIETLLTPVAIVYSPK